MHRDLLGQARHLLDIDPRRPRQANLRRAVSTAYYAAFHCLGSATTELILPARHQELRAIIRRALDHSAMKKAASAFGGGTPPALYLPALNVPPTGRATLEPELRELAAAFVNLQEQRHTADYDLSRPMTRHAASEAVDQADLVIANDEALRSNGSTNYEVFLLALLLQKNLDKR